MRCCASSISPASRTRSAMRSRPTRSFCPGQEEILSATFFIEIPDAEQRHAALKRMGGVEEERSGSGSRNAAAAAEDKRGRSIRSVERPGEASGGLVSALPGAGRRRRGAARPARSRSGSRSTTRAIPMPRASPARRWPSWPKTWIERLESGAGDGNRTRVRSLGSFYSTIELRPRRCFMSLFISAVKTARVKFVDSGGSRTWRNVPSGRRKGGSKWNRGNSFSAGCT